MELRVGRLDGTARGARLGGAGRGACGFDELLAEEAPPAAVAGPCEALAVVVPEPGPERDRVARRQGKRVLGALRCVQLALLSGQGGATAAARLAEAAAGLPDAADPGLQAVLREIRVRAAIERARQEAGQ